MAGIQTFFVLIVIVAHLTLTSADHHLTSEDSGSCKVVGSHSSLLNDDNGVNHKTGIYVLTRQRRSPHFGLGSHYHRPIYAQHHPIAVAPAYYPGGHHAHGSPHLTNSHSQAQSISASFGNNHLLGGGSSGISAASASAGSGTNQLLHHHGGYGRK